MATVCGGTLSLMDAGVPIKAPVAGIAMGLVTQDDDFKVLTDIAGAEDHYGDMDFKVAGTEAGITALQMDIKQPKVSLEVLDKALAQAREARLEILSTMGEAISEPRSEIAEHAPQITQVKIPVAKIRDLIGLAARHQGIQEETGAKIDVDDEGNVSVASTDRAKAKEGRSSASRPDGFAGSRQGIPRQGHQGSRFGAFIEIFRAPRACCTSARSPSSMSAR